ncbi:MAG: hypothetical protein Q9227_003610 [Pyrenula ochraceoflavens]
MDLSFITTLGDKVKDAFGKADEQDRRRITDTLREIQFAVEPPEETMQRLIHQNLTIAMVRVALDLKIYNVLVQATESVSLKELVTRTKVDPVLLGRIMRHQSSMGLVDEVGKGTYAANNLTRNLSIPEIQSGIYFNNDVMGPVYQAIPAFLKEKNYQNPTGNKTAFQYTWKTDHPIFRWFEDHPFEGSHFNNYMKAQRMSTPNCFSFFNVQELCKDFPSDKPVFVDIGGGIGHQCAALLDKFPDLQGTVILQDLPSVVAEAQVPRDVQVMAYDFFDPQPVKGAKFYYLRAVLHDHDDLACLKILKRVYDAMGTESVLLLDEIVAPTTNIDWYVTQTDLTMMVGHGGMERTREAWGELLDKAGMEIRYVTTYTSAFQLSIVEVVKKEMGRK